MVPMVKDGHFWECLDSLLTGDYDNLDLEYLEKVRPDFCLKKQLGILKCLEKKPNVSSFIGNGPAVRLFWSAGGSVRSGNHFRQAVEQVEN